MDEIEILEPLPVLLDIDLVVADHPLAIYQLRALRAELECAKRDLRIAALGNKSE